MRPLLLGSNSTEKTKLLGRGLAFVVVMVAPMLDYWEGIHPPCLDEREAVLISGTLAAITFGVGLAAMQGKPVAALVRLLKRCCAGTVLILVIYLSLFFSFSLPLPDHYHREIIGWRLTDDAESRLAGPIPKSPADLVREWNSDVEKVFTSSSVGIMRTVFVIVWTLLFICFGLAMATATGIREQSSCAGVYELDNLGHRVETLGQKNPQLAELLGHAYRYIRTDPGSSLTKSRMILETVVLKMYQMAMGRPPRKPLLGEMLNDNQFTRTLGDSRIVDLMNVIRTIGNFGPHGNQGTSEDAASALDRLCEVIEWESKKESQTRWAANA
jgi:hypothetical protein